MFTKYLGFKMDEKLTTNGPMEMDIKCQCGNTRIKEMTNKESRTFDVYIEDDIVDE